MSYILFLIAFLMTVVSIMGDTWKNRKPTPVGWSILALAAIVLSVTVGKHYIEHQETYKITEVARVQACRAAYNIASPFAVLLAGATINTIDKGKISEDIANELLLEVDEFLRVSQEDNLSQQFAGIFDDLPTLLDHASFLRANALGAHSPLRQHQRNTPPSQKPPPLPWRKIFETTSSKGVTHLDATLSIYGSVLTSDEIASIQGLRNNWLTERLDNLTQYPDTMSLIDFLPLDYKPTEEDENNIYEEFLVQMQKVVRLCPSPQK